MKNNTMKNTHAPLADLMRQWVWDVLYRLDGQNNFISPHGFERTDIAQLIGADAWFEDEEDFDPAVARRRLRAA